MVRAWHSRGAGRRWPAAGAPLALAVALLAACSAGATERDEEWRAAAAMTGGDPARGPALIRRYGCGTCHTVEGVAGATGLVGPPLTGIASRSYIAGVLPNEPANMVRWILNPKGVDPLTAMPNTGLTEREARDVAAYLYTLR